MKNWREEQWELNTPHTYLEYQIYKPQEKYLEKIMDLLIEKCPDELRAIYEKLA